MFEYTRFGAYCKCIGENELTSASSGIDTTKIKILAFVLSGTMVGIAGAFNVARLGGASTTIGSMFEMRVMMSLYIGGIPISGGTKSKMYKLILGAFILAVLENGLTISGVMGPLYEFIEGVVLITVVASTLFLNRQSRIKGQKIAAESAA
ncbi:MAG: hypothetical protein IKN57_12315 [Parasporobacterium sp.]|nr:hypothetical protein [Parasporobacterium sp.]